MRFYLVFRCLIIVLLVALVTAIGLIFYEPLFLTTSTTVLPSTPQVSMLPWKVGVLTALAAVFALIFGKVADLWLQGEIAERNRREMCVALYAEISIKLEQQAESFALQKREEVYSRLENDLVGTVKQVESDTTIAAVDGAKLSIPPSSVPVGASNLALEAVKGQIFTLPKSTIEPTMRYYTLDAMVDVAIKTTEDDDFNRFSPERRAARWNEIFILAEKAQKAGRSALASLAVQARLSEKTRLKAIGELKYDAQEWPDILRESKAKPFAKATGKCGPDEKANASSL